MKSRRESEKTQSRLILEAPAKMDELSGVILEGLARQAILGVGGVVV